MSADEFLAVQRDLEEASRPRPKHPTGWEPGVDTERGSVTVLSDQSTAPSSWAEIIRQFSLDPAEWTVDETQPVQVRTWDSGDKRMFYYRAAIRPLRGPQNVEVDALIRRVRKHRPAKQTASQDVPRALIVAISDWQAGKSDGDGVEGLVERVERLREAVPERIRQLKRAGTPVDRLYVCAMGDLVEGCDGHYAQQTFDVALDRRDQVKLVRRMLVDCLTTWAKIVPDVVVTAVPGNHGENRKDGRSFTTFEDNDDLAVVEQAGEILAANPDAYGHVRFVLPDKDLTLTLDVAGTIVGFAHGHQARRGTGPAGKIANWWKDKAASRHRIGDADVLITGHYHHLIVVADGPRTWFQCPALDGGSRWWEEQGGSATVAGTLTLTVDESGWGNVAVLQ